MFSWDELKELTIKPKINDISLDCLSQYYYNAHGIQEGKNLIITSDGDNGSLDSKEIDNLIKRTFDL
ncbi:hypothetical protein [Butyrivibrio sp. FC2001]|uniref:hypothetical protein n=1 Tax=Butyrivibrio sp. FC2001 TaxID=1280671 RepID=UPI0004125E72|nr:hypothetical protein [Butyrivibrio sp. FC2001]